MGTRGCRYAAVWRKFGVNSEVDKWFSNARHGFRAYEKESSNAGHSMPVKQTEKKSPGGSIRNKQRVSIHRCANLVNKQLHEAFEENPYPSREKKESLAQELGMAFHQVNKWFDNMRSRSRTSSDKSISQASSFQISRLDSMQFDKSLETAS
ncbi:Homeobox protein HOX1A [Apostasia shenzhenica]|uniref:Homeobox protein HOX1A n=1 Tax=Apostasia shenzhenica TaxID=1088818 RepID=A0A2I0AAF5_9ASPA|nr:Homeobox protein HOX1A [Apostasia shenzhenica]